jgi:hypothetical protein
MGFFSEDADDEDSAASADFVTVDESGFFDARAVEESAVAAFEIEEAAAFFAAVDGEVEAGHSFVVGNAMVGLGMATDAEKLAGL